MQLIQPVVRSFAKGASKMLRATGHARMVSMQPTAALHLLHCPHSACCSVALQLVRRCQTLHSKRFKNRGRVRAAYNIAVHSGSCPFVRWRSEDASCYATCNCIHVPTFASLLRCQRAEHQRCSCCAQQAMRAWKAKFKIA